MSPSGCGVFTTIEFNHGDFLLEYRGDYLDCEEAENVDDQTFLYYFEKGKYHYWLVCEALVI